ncbi:probable 26S proteasome complex subunit sem1 [Teleopsis dalmanni]|uniref:probable 26S proteasome complex subunit sem1 n=1 Tax=Teleopsis dalmanni TaxID=139649 RepID=UPI0018CE3659|nr:probable 26S proteasome complex subunit sem1 [Teleopsis dalmanni]
MSTTVKEEDKVSHKSDHFMLEEDDEFEDFPPEDFNINTEEDDILNVWDDNWDDDNVEDDFSQQLKAHLVKQSLEMQVGDSR